MATPEEIIAALPIGKNNAMKVADVECQNKWTNIF